MRVLKTEAGQMHHRIAVRDVVGVAVGIKQQVRRVHHPDPVAAGQRRVGQAEFVGENLVRVVSAIAVGVIVHGDTAAAGRVMRRRPGLAVVLGSVILVATNLPQPGRVRVLHIMRNPQPPARIETDMRRLRHQRLVQHGLDGQAVGQLESRKALAWAEPLAVHQRLRLEKHATGLVKLVVGGTGRLGLERLAKRRQLCAWSIFPLAAEQALEKVALYRRAVAPELAEACGVENLDGEFVPLALAQAAGRHLVALGLSVAWLGPRRKAARATEAFAVEERLVRGVARVNCQRDRLDPKIASAERRPIVRHLHPASVPAGADWPRAAGLPRHGDRLPFQRPSARPSGKEAKQQN